MKDEKEPLEQKQNSEEEEYSFLQEIIKDEAGDQAKWKHDVLRRIQLGLIFGLVACFTFFACKPWVEKRFEEDSDGSNNSTGRTAGRKSDTAGRGTRPGTKNRSDNRNLSGNAE